MSHSFEGVRLIKVSSGGGNATPNPEDSSDESIEKTVEVSPTGKVTIHKHSSGDNDYLAIPLAFIVFGFGYLIVRATMAPFHNKKRIAGQPTSGGGLSEEEIAILQKLERTLSQMESRVEALETILIDQNRTTAKNYGSKF